MASARSRDEVTLRGLRWMAAGLGLFLAAVLALLALFLLLLPTILEVMAGDAPRAAADDPLGTISLALLVVDIAAVFVFGVGYADLWGRRDEWGQDHARSVAQSLPYLLLTGLIAFVGILVPSYTGPVYRVPIPGDTLPTWAVTAGILVGGTRALFAGLALYFLLQGLAEPPERTRLVLGMILGVVGGVAWPGLVAYGLETAAAPGDLLTALASGAVAGLGTSAVSLAVFLRVARGIGRRIEGTA